MVGRVVGHWACLGCGERIHPVVIIVNVAGYSLLKVLRGHLSRLAHTRSRPILVAIYCLFLQTWGWYSHHGVLLGSLSLTKMLLKHL